MKIAIVICAEVVLLLSGVGADRVAPWIPTWAIFAGVAAFGLAIPILAYWPWRRAVATRIGGAREPAPEPGPLQGVLWKTSPGAGRLAARAIMEAASLEDAHAIFDAHHAAPNPKDTAWAAYALMKHMDAAGEDIYPLALSLLNEGIDITDHLEEIERDYGLPSGARA